MSRYSDLFNKTDSVTNRALFNRRAARDKLDTMSYIKRQNDEDKASQSLGILGSSPELAATALRASPELDRELKRRAFMQDIRNRYRERERDRERRKDERGDRDVSVPRLPNGQPMPILKPKDEYVAPVTNQTFTETDTGIMGLMPNGQPMPVIKPKDEYVAPVAAAVDPVADLMSTPAAMTAPAAPVLPDANRQALFRQRLQTATQSNPFGYQEGGPVDVTAPTPGVDISQSPLAPQRSPVPTQAPDIAALVDERLSNNPEARAAFTQLQQALADPNLTEEQRTALITGAAGQPNTEAGLRNVAEDITGEAQPSGASIDELNQAIMRAAVGGAIGGPRSVAERISNAVIAGLQVQRDTLMAREENAARVAAAALRRSNNQDGADGWLSTPQGEAALELYTDYTTQRNLSHDDAIARLNELSSDLGRQLESAMGSSTASSGATPETPATDMESIVSQVRALGEEEAFRYARESIDDGADRALIEQILTDAGYDVTNL